MATPLTLVPVLRILLQGPRTLSSVSSLALDFRVPVRTCTQTGPLCLQSLPLTRCLTSAQMFVVGTAVVMVGTPAVTLAGSVPVKFLVAARTARFQISCDSQDQQFRVRGPQAFPKPPLQEGSGKGIAETTATCRTSMFTAS